MSRRGSGAQAAALVLWVLAFTLPLAALGVASFSGRWPFPRVLPETWSLRAWAYAASSAPRIAASLASSTLYSLAAVLLGTGLSLPAARSLAAARRGGALEALLLLPAVLPPASYAFGLNRLFLAAGLGSSWPAVVIALAFASYPYQLRTLIAGYRHAGTGFGDCARNLGAGPVRTWLTVEIPVLLPALAAGGSVAFLVCFSDYFLVFLTGGGRVDSFTGFLAPFLASSDRSLGAAFSLLFLAVPLAGFGVLEGLLRAFHTRRGLAD